MASPTDDQSTSGSKGTATFLLGAIGLLAALLTALATANGGVDRIERNERWTLFAGVVCVLIAIAAGALYTALSASGATTSRTRKQAKADRQTHPPRLRGVLHRGPRPLSIMFHRRTLLLVGVLALAGRLITVAYAAVEHVAGRPSVTASITTDKKLGVLISGQVTVSDIGASTHLEMRVDALIPGHVHGANKLVPRAIYAASFGPTHQVMSTTNTKSSSRRTPTKSSYRHGPGSTATASTTRSLERPRKHRSQTISAAFA